MSEERNYYDVLGIRPGARQADVELAFKGRRTQYHPDKYADADRETQQWATAEMQAVNQAYTVLSDVEKRRHYDARLAAFDTANDRSSDSGPNSRGDWSTFRSRRASERDARQSSTRHHGQAQSTGAYGAAVQRQLLADLEITRADLFDDDAESEPQDSSDAIVVELLSFIPEQCTRIVCKYLDRLDFVRAHEELAVAIGRAQFLVTILSMHSISMLPQSFIEAMGRDFHSLQVFPMRQFELVLEEFSRRGSEFHLGLSELVEPMTSVLVGIIGAPQYKPLSVEISCSREEFVCGFLGEDPLKVPSELAHQLIREAGLVSDALMAKAAAALAAEEAQEAKARKEARETREAQARRETASADSRRFHTSSDRNSGSSRDEPLIDDYLRLVELEQGDRSRFHFVNRIPPGKLAKGLAGRRFASERPPAKVHLLVDDTVFQGGADGLVITDEVISFREIFSESTDYRYQRGWNGGFNASGRKITRFGEHCIGFSLISACAVQSLVWQLNQFFSDRRGWYEGRAEHGDVEAQFFMSSSCHGDPGAELHWLTLAAEGGHPTAQHNLGMHYLHEEPQRAWQWFTKAARQGNARSEQEMRRDIFRNFR